MPSSVCTAAVRESGGGIAAATEPTDEFRPDEATGPVLPETDQPQSLPPAPASPVLDGGAVLRIVRDLRRGAFALTELIATARDMTLSDLVAAIDSERQHGNLSSAIRLFVLDFYRNGHSEHKDGRDASRDLMAARAATGV